MTMTLWLPHRLPDDTLQATQCAQRGTCGVAGVCRDRVDVGSVVGGYGGRFSGGGRLTQGIRPQRAQGSDRWLAGVLVAEWLLGLLVLCTVSPHTALAKSLTHGAVGHWAPGVFRCDGAALGAGGRGVR